MSIPVLSTPSERPILVQRRVMTVNNGSISDGNVVYVFSDPVPEGADLKVDTTIGHVSLALPSYGATVLKPRQLLSTVSKRTLCRHSGPRTPLLHSSPCVDATR